MQPLCNYRVKSFTRTQTWVLVNMTEHVVYVHWLSCRLRLHPRCRVNSVTEDAVARQLGPDNASNDGACIMIANLKGVSQRQGLLFTSVHSCLDLNGFPGVWPDDHGCCFPHVQRHRADHDDVALAVGRGEARGHQVVLGDGFNLAKSISGLTRGKRGMRRRGSEK